MTVNIGSLKPLVELLEAAAELGAQRPQLAAKDLFALVDPERDEDYVDFVATRW